MATTTNLGKVHVFPSEDSYNTNKGSVGATDLALVPIGAATTAKAGLVRLASESDVLAESEDATMNVPLAYELNDFRRISKTYAVGDKVNCAFRFEYFLECIQAGTTSAESLDTRNVTFGQEITDGTVKWVVRTHIKSVNGILPDAEGDVKNIARTDLANTFVNKQVIKNSGESLPNEGGMFILEKSTTTNLTDNVAFSVGGDTFRVHEIGGQQRGFRINLTQCKTGIGTWLVRSINGIEADSNGNISADSLGFVVQTGLRGKLSGYETMHFTSGASVSIGYLTPDYIVHNANEQTSLTVNLDGGNLIDNSTAGAVKILFIFNASAVTSLSFNTIGGITQTDILRGAPELSGKSIIRIVVQFHDITATMNIEQWGVIV